MSIDYRTSPDKYRHWSLDVDPPLAFLRLGVSEDPGGDRTYRLKQNSYDLGVDIELADAVQRLRFEHPSVRCVVIESSDERVFCAGANIGMLAESDHQAKVNFCKFTNETRLAIEEASRESSQSYLCAVQGTAAGGGYELALACDHILLADDGSSAVSLPEVPLLGVLPGTGGLTRLTDKRGVRRDRADVFCTQEEGLRGRKALDWGLVDELAPRSSLAERVRARAEEMASASDRPLGSAGARWPRLERVEARADGGPSGMTFPGGVGPADTLEYSSLRVAIDRDRSLARFQLRGPESEAPVTGEATSASVGYWPLALARELDDAVLHLRSNEPEIGLWLFSSEGHVERVLDYDRQLAAATGGDEWFLREVRLFWGRVFRRIETSSRSTFTLVEPGSCFGGFLSELLFLADRTYMWEGEGENGEAPPTFELSGLNRVGLPMHNGLSRLETRFLHDADHLQQVHGLEGGLDAEAALEAGLVTDIYDDIDWDDEIRLVIEERVSFSADALTGLEANLRYPGPETLATKIFARLSAWQNWIFQRPNAVGENGALRRYGTGLRPEYDRRRV